MAPSSMLWRMLVAALVVMAGAAHADAGRSRFTLHCAGCHQLDGSGATEIGVPPMKGVIGNFLSLPAGRDFLVQVPGSSQSALDDAQLASELNWIIRTMAEQSMPPDFQPYSEAEVHALRNHRPENITALRRKITDELRASGHPVN